MCIYIYMYVYIYTYIYIHIYDSVTMLYSRNRQNVINLKKGKEKGRKECKAGILCTDSNTHSFFSVS